MRGVSLGHSQDRKRLAVARDASGIDVDGEGRRLVREPGMTSETFVEIEAPVGLTAWRRLCYRPRHARDRLARAPVQTFRIHR